MQSAQTKRRWNPTAVEWKGKSWAILCEQQGFPNRILAAGFGEGTPKLYPLRKMAKEYADELAAKTHNRCRKFSVVCVNVVVCSNEKR